MTEQPQPEPSLGEKIIDWLKYVFLPPITPSAVSSTVPCDKQGYLSIQTDQPQSEISLGEKLKDIFIPPITAPGLKEVDLSDPENKGLVCEGTNLPPRQHFSDPVRGPR